MKYIINWDNVILIIIFIIFFIALNKTYEIQTYETKKEFSYEIGMRIYKYGYVSGALSSIISKDDYKEQWKKDSIKTSFILKNIVNKYKF